MLCMCYNSVLDSHLTLEIKPSSFFQVYFIENRTMQVFIGRIKKTLLSIARVWGFQIDAQLSKPNAINLIVYQEQFIEKGQHRLPFGFCVDFDLDIKLILSILLVQQPTSRLLLFVRIKRRHPQWRCRHILNVLPPNRRTIQLDDLDLDDEARSIESFNLKRFTSTRAQELRATTKYYPEIPPVRSHLRRTNQRSVISTDSF